MIKCTWYAGASSVVCLELGLGIVEDEVFPFADLEQLLLISAALFRSNS